MLADFIGFLSESIVFSCEVNLSRKKSRAGKKMGNVNKALSLTDRKQYLVTEQGLCFEHAHALPHITLDIHTF